MRSVGASLWVLTRIGVPLGFVIRRPHPRRALACGRDKASVPYHTLGGPHAATADGPGTYQHLQRLDRVEGVLIIQGLRELVDLQDRGQKAQEDAAWNQRTGGMWHDAPRLW